VPTVASTREERALVEALSATPRRAFGRIRIIPATIFADSAISMLPAPPNPGADGPGPVAHSPPPDFAVVPAARSVSRWSVSAWLLQRREQDGPALAPGGTLGGSQAGGRLLYRINRDAAVPLSLSGRLYSPLHAARGAEAAAGIDWRPFARLPLHLLAERRQALGRDGRSAFALTFYGGHGGRLPGGLRLDAYGQAGIVGLRSRDLFIDGAVRLGVPVGPVEVGAGAWGAAQPGAARLDAGPQASVRLPMLGTDVRLSADWRFRLAGDAAPGSGPALTVASDF
jgi:hypothetical protein